MNSDDDIIGADINLEVASLSNTVLYDIDLSIMY